MKKAKITDEMILMSMQKRWGKTHEINKVYGTHVDLSTLPKGVSVCYGDGKTYHFQLKEKTTQQVTK